MSEFESNYTLDKLFSNQIEFFEKNEALVIEKNNAKISSIETKIKNCKDEEKSKNTKQE